MVVELPQPAKTIRISEYVVSPVFLDRDRGLRVGLRLRAEAIDG
jgi:hypothetical protein